MTANQITGNSLAFDVVDRIIILDALLGHCDEDDHSELTQRIAALDPAEFKNILSTFGAKPVLAAVAGDSSDEDPKESAADVA